MASSVIDFITSKIDPLQFFAPASTNAASLSPYAVSGGSSSSGFADFSDTHADIASFALRNYALSVLTSPLRVVGTLAEIQYQRREELVAPTTQKEQDHALIHDEKLPPLVNGPWENIRDVVETDGEGLSSILKGHFTHFAFNACYTILQPALEEALNDAFDVYEETNPITAVLSHATVGTLLSPLEIAETRLIAQPSSTHRKKYYGPIHALHAIATEEGHGITGLYPLRHLFPTILIHTLSPLMRIASTLVISEELGLDPTFTPAYHHMATLAFMALEVAIITPFDVARRRLQIQRLNGTANASSRITELDQDLETGTHLVASPQQPFDTAVDVSPHYYSGIWDVISSIISEEGGSQRKSRRRRRRRNLGGPLNTTSSTPLSPKSKRTRQPSSDTYNEWHQLPHADAEYGVHDPWWNGAQSSNPSSTTPSSSKGIVVSIQRFASGVRALYRGFWPRYISRAVVYGFHEISQPEDTTW
ncbi:mitochondrial carrier domain-containing protein [Phlyctochytrium arcticum]|nr:mitochondrial carrier domain-containing protein [Phlyctochytrium arcticum]